MSFWLLLVVVSLVTLLACAVFAVTRFLAVLRQAGETMETLGASLERISAGAERAAARGDAAGAAAARLERAAGRLDRSRARLQILLGAYADARSTLGSFVFVPRK